MTPDGDLGHFLVKSLSLAGKSNSNQAVTCGVNTETRADGTSSWQEEPVSLWPRIAGHGQLPPEMWEVPNVNAHFWACDEGLKCVY